MNTKLSNSIKTSLWVITCISSIALAGDLDAPAAPDNAGSAMFTLQDICNRLDVGTAGSKRSGAFTEPSGAPASTNCSIDTIMANLPAEDSDAASTTEVFAGQKYWGLKNGTWGLQTGAMEIKVLSVGSENVVAGVYGATTLSTVEPNLSSNNIKSGVTIFGISGNSNVVDTSSGDASSFHIKTDKKAWVDGVLVTGKAFC